jgi:hypothetical protein
MSERGSKALAVSTENADGSCLLMIAAQPPQDDLAAGAQVSAEESDGLALSACQGILQEHGGRISYEPRVDGALVLRVELPSVESAVVQEKPATVPGLWQSQPFA